MKKSLLYICMLGLGIFAFTSCSDPMDEITDVTYDRVFSPTDVETKTVGEATATVTWNAPVGATSYLVEVYEDDSLTFVNAPKLSLEASTNSITLTDLVYDTDYSLKVYALDGENASRNSKGTEIYFRTSAQQIFKAIKEDNIADKSVTLSWPAEETNVTRIDILDATSGEVVVSHALTAEEIAAGTATVDGISPETKYTAKLYYVSNGIQKERGSKTFTTIADLEGAILLHSDDDIQSIIRDANDGDTFALYGGTYVVKSGSDDTSVTAGSIVVSKNITIKGIYPTNVPTINGRFELQDGASLTINQVNMDGAGTSGDQCFNFKGTNVGFLYVENAEIKNYTKGVHYINVAARVAYVRYKKCLIHDIVCDGGDMFDCRKGCTDILEFSESTIYNSCASRDFIRFDDASGSFEGATPKIIVNKCTIDNVATASGKRLLYVRFVGNSIEWKNNIVTNVGGVWSNQSKTAVPDFYNNFYYGCSKLNVLDGSEGGKTNLFIDESRTEADPQYANASEGDFTVGNSSVSKFSVGDPRWY